MDWTEHHHDSMFLCSSYFESDRAYRLDERSIIERCNAAMLVKHRWTHFVSPEWRPHKCLIFQKLMYADRDAGVLCLFSSRSLMQLTYS